MTETLQSHLNNPFVAYPMVEASAATGRVASVYADAAGRLPFVPSILKSLAVCPPYLVLAWHQVRGMLDAPELADAVEQIKTAARTGTRPPVSTDAVEVLRPFVDPLTRMLLVSCGLHAALAGSVTGALATADLSTDHSPVGDDAPSPFEHTDLETYARLRAALDTPLVNTVWRTLSAAGQLENSWPVLEQVAQRSRSHAARIQMEAYQSAVGLPWSPVASVAALRDAGIADAAPGMTAILDAYVKTLPRVLVLLADL